MAGAQTTGGLVMHRFEEAARATVPRLGHTAIERMRLYEVQDAVPNRLAWFDTAVYVPPGDTTSWTPGAKDVERASFELRRSLQSDVAGLEAARWLYVVHTDIPSDIASEYNAWYDEEHLPRLIKVPGIVRARRYAAPDQSPRYLTAYELSDRDAFTTSAGLKARNTPWTAQMRNLFRNTRRFTGSLLQTS